LNVANLASLSSGLNVAGAANVGGAANVTGLVSVAGGLNVSSVTNLQNVLNVANLASLSSGLNVAGAANVGGAANVTGLVSVAGGLNVSSVTNLQNVLNVANLASLSSGLNVTGAANITGLVSLGNGLNVSSITNLQGALNVKGDVSIASTLNVSSLLRVNDAATFNSSLTVFNNFSTVLNGSLYVEKPTVLRSTLSVTGDATFLAGLLVEGNLTVTGTTTTLSTINLSVEDAGILIADQNLGDSIQTGLQIQYSADGTTKRYAGLMRFSGAKANDAGSFALFKDSTKLIESTMNNDDVLFANLLCNSFTCSSDLNLKCNIVTLNSTLHNIDGLRGVYHDWNNQEQSSKRQIGVIAQEVQAIYPELVSMSGNGYLCVDYPKLTAVLLQAVKELKAMVLEISSKVA
jgi:hypothetical protein